MSISKRSISERSISNMSVLSLPSSTQSEPMMRRKSSLLVHNTSKDDSWLVDDEIMGEGSRSISPVLLSDQQLPAWSGSRWRRLFPELTFQRHVGIKALAPVTTQVNSPDIDHSHHEPINSAGLTCSSVLSDDVPDSASSCYSRRSSVTSVESEPTLSPSKPLPDSYAVFSPTLAGVFDDPPNCRRRSTRRRSDSSTSDPVAVRRSISRAHARFNPSMEAAGKPLPPLPESSEMPPLALRPKPRHPSSWPTSSRHGSPLAAARTQSDGDISAGHRPTFSQAARELEDTLAVLTDHEPDRNPYPQKFVYILDGPLQISRCTTDLTPSRPAPKPPVDLAQNQVKVTRKSSSAENLPPAKKRNSPSPSFSVAVRRLSKKYYRSHKRSTSSPGPEIPGPETQPIQEEADLTPAESTNKEAGGETTKEANKELNHEAAIMSGSVTPTAPFSPDSLSHARELRLKLPRLDTQALPANGRTGVKSNQPTPEPKEEVNKRPQPSEPDHSERPVETDRPIETVRSMCSEEKIFVASSKQAPGESGGGSGQVEMDYAMGLEMVYELDGGGPTHSAVGGTTSSPAVPASRRIPTMPVSIPDRVALQFLENVRSLDDLFHLALVSKQFYRVFKENELDLVKNALYTMSPAAWELREMSPPWASEWHILVDPDAPVPDYTPSLYLQRYGQDIFTLAQLKSLLLARCGGFLRPETVQGLTGASDARAAAVDDAFWRIWTFCRIFGCGKNREADTDGQLDWLRGGPQARNRHHFMACSVTEPFGMDSVLFEPPDGFGQGNPGGLSREQQYDMTEIWTCLGVLLQPIHGRCEEARDVGIFAGHGLPDNDPAKEEALLEEWTYYILTLGPTAVLNLGSISLVDNPMDTFQQAQAMGLTRWEQPESGISRSMFLKDAVRKAYMLDSTHPTQQSLTVSSSSSSSSSSRPNSRDSRSLNGTEPAINMTPLPSHRRRQKIYANQLRDRRNQPQNSRDISFGDERPISSYSFIMTRLEGLPYDKPPPVPSASGASYVAHNIAPPTSSPPPPPSLSSSSSAEYLPNQNHAPKATQPPPPPQPAVAGPSYSSWQPQVRDPVDHAIEVMVRDYGFQEQDAKWALKVTDGGDGINANAAIALLMREQKNTSRSIGLSMHFKKSSTRSKKSKLASSVISSQEAANAGWRWA
ncbi:hypothetical protein BDW42DRAFT_64304 [Aspergillus taichungensis]|uniref:Uncharacterized protein n=1 Tax=Aspergillus taichungensis TaxID=482145 RepID=A0A2J5I1D1_9EURO|nr:hypothetical protein BDW42DRAFT_64304 [Aspergillus taichungensis]